MMREDQYKDEDFHKTNLFFRDSWSQIPDRKIESRFMRPRFVVRNKVDTTGIPGKYILRKEFSRHVKLLRVVKQSM